MGGGHYYKEMSKFGYFKKMAKVRINLDWLRKLTPEMIFFTQNVRYKLSCQAVSNYPINLPLDITLILFNPVEA